MDKESRLPQIFDGLKEYINLKIRISMLTLGEKAARASAVVFSSLVFVVLVVMFVFFGSIAVAVILEKQLGTGFGFLIVAGFYLLIGLIAFLFRGKIQTKLMDVFIKMFFGDGEK